MKRLLGLCLCISFVSCSNSMPRTAATPPATKTEPVTETLHGVEIADPYRWLEGDNSNPDDQGKVTPEVAGWTDSQNGYTRSVLDALPQRQALEQRLRPLMEVGSVSRPIVRGTPLLLFQTRRHVRISRSSTGARATKGRTGSSSIRPGSTSQA